MTRPVESLMPLSLLTAGQKGRIGMLLGQPDQVHRLEEMGLRGGAEIEMLQPGNPCIVRLAGHKLCFRGDELVRVMVNVGGVA